MKVSVAIATYNGRGHLREQLASIAGQTRLPAELVVGDDGSTDDTLDIVRAFAETAPFPVRILDKPTRMGFSDNFLSIAEACEHEAIAFCDQDDVWLPNKLEVCTGRLRDDNSLIALHALTVVDATLRPTGLHWVQGADHDRVFEPLEFDPYHEGWGNSIVVRREIVHLVDRTRRPPQPENQKLPLSHDTWVYMLAAALGRVSIVAAPLILYRQHGGNVVGVSAGRPLGRLGSLTQVRKRHWREQAIINARMVPIFAEIASHPGPLAEPARAAAACFEKRHALMDARAGIFDRPTAAARYQAFRDFQRLAGPPAPGLGSQVKSLVLGVSGLNLSGPGRGVRVE